MGRVNNWRAALTDYVIETAGEPFAIGKSDCAMWAAGAVQAMTGKDFARGFRGYTTIAGGLRKLKARGFADHVALAAANFEEVPPAFAEVGDIAVVEGDDGTDALGIVQGEMIYVSWPTGRAIVPLTSAKRAFRV